MTDIGVYSTFAIDPGAKKKKKKKRKKRKKKGFSYGTRFKIRLLILLPFFRMWKLAQKYVTKVIPFTRICEKYNEI
jgi:hypothetical protein